MLKIQLNLTFLNLDFGHPIPHLSLTTNHEFNALSISFLKYSRVRLHQNRRSQQTCLPHPRKRNNSK